MLSDVTPLIQKLTEGKDLTIGEAEKAFRILEEKDKESYFFFTFLAALHTKGETADELLGFCKANEHFVPRFNVGIEASKIIDLSGTGGDKIKTPNISTAASFVVAGAGITVAKQAFLGVTGLTGSADVMQAFGVDPLAVSREGPDKIRNILKQVGMVVYHANSMASPEKRKGFFNFWLKRMPETGLAFVNAYHLAANVYSPIPMEKRLYGVFDEKYLRPLAELFQKLGYKKGLVVHGTDGLDEVSTVGPTKVVEYTAKRIKEYTVTPKDLGLKKANYTDIKAISRERNIIDFLRILYGKERGPRRDIVLANTAVAFYVMDKVKNLANGVRMAGKVIDEGLAFKKLKQLVDSIGDTQKLESWKNKAGI